MKKKQLTAVATERLFGVVILLLLIGLVVDFIFVTNFLKSEAVKTETLHAQSDATDSDIAKLKSANAWLQDNEDVLERTSNVVAQSKLYQYQNQIIEDLDGYGKQAGVIISGYSFTLPSSGTPSAPAAGASPGSTPGATSPPPSTPAAPGAANASSKVPSGINSTSVTVTFGDKIGYQNFLNFLRLVEKNVTRMQVTNMSLNPDSLDGRIISNPNITLIVYME